MISPEQKSKATIKKLIELGFSFRLVYFNEHDERKEIPINKLILAEPLGLFMETLAGRIQVHLKHVRRIAAFGHTKSADILVCTEE